MKKGELVKFKKDLCTYNLYIYKGKGEFGEALLEISPALLTLRTKRSNIEKANDTHIQEFLINGLAEDLCGEDYSFLR